MLQHESPTDCPNFCLVLLFPSIHSLSLSHSHILGRRMLYSVIFVVVVIFETTSTTINNNNSKPSIFLCSCFSLSIVAWFNSSDRNLPFTIQFYFFIYFFNHTYTSLFFFSIRFVGEIHIYVYIFFFSTNNWRRMFEFTRIVKQKQYETKKKKKKRRNKKKKSISKVKVIKTAATMTAVGPVKSTLLEYFILF